MGGYGRELLSNPKPQGNRAKIINHFLTDESQQYTILKGKDITLKDFVPRLMVAMKLALSFFLFYIYI